MDDGSMGVVILEGGDKDFILHRLRAMVDECCGEFLTNELITGFPVYEILEFTYKNILFEV